MDWNDFNPDSMTVDELAQWHKAIQNLDDIKNIPEFKGNTLDDVSFDLDTYITYKIIAVANRTIGNIAKALQYEKICDVIYDVLPNEIKW